VFWVQQYRALAQLALAGWCSDIRAQKSPRREGSLSAGAIRRRNQYLICGFPGCDVIYIPFLSWFGDRHSPVRRIVCWQFGRGNELVGFQSRFQQFCHGRRSRPGCSRPQGRSHPEGHHEAPAPSAECLQPIALVTISTPPAQPSFGGIGRCAGTPVGVRILPSCQLLSWHVLRLTPVSSKSDSCKFSE
jgi:hypothetical protein